MQPELQEKQDRDQPLSVSYAAYTFNSLIPKAKRIAEFNDVLFLHLNSHGI